MEVTRGFYRQSTGEYVDHITPEEEKKLGERMWDSLLSLSDRAVGQPGIHISDTNELIHTIPQ